MFETGPFRSCPRCRKDSFGILSVGGRTLTRRCAACRYSHSEELPAVDKKVVYLDQFAISELFKIKTNKRRVGAPHEAFWRDVLTLADRAYLRQQVVFPASNIHSDETIVWHSPDDLKIAHAMLSGETSFRSTDDIAAEHELEFANAYLLQQAPPKLVFDVDDVLSGDRNVWLPKFHIDVKMNLSMFADGIRADKGLAEEKLGALADRWASEKPTFDSVLRYELSSYGSATKHAITHAFSQAQKAISSNDPMSILDLRTGWISRFNGLRFFFEQRGVPRGESGSAVTKFLDWPGNERQPTHRISAYLFAALAWRISSGQRPNVKASVLNDFTAISTYAPYVDAMFVDNQCASLLNEGRLRTELTYNARIFSLSSRDEFLQYLTDLGDSAAGDVRADADDIYGKT